MMFVLLKKRCICPFNPTWILAMLNYCRINLFKN